MKMFWYISPLYLAIVVFFQVDKEGYLKRKYGAAHGRVRIIVVSDRLHLANDQDSSLVIA